MVILQLIRTKPGLWEDAVDGKRGTELRLNRRRLGLQKREERRRDNTAHRSRWRPLLYVDDHLCPAKTKSNKL